MRKGTESLLGYRLLAGPVLMLAATLANAQTWGAPQFVTRQQAYVMATNGIGTSAMLITPQRGTSYGLSVMVENGSSWGAPTAISSNAVDDKLAVAANGDIVVAWRSSSGLQAAFYTAGHWGSTQTLSPSEPAGFSLAYDGISHATIVWESHGPSSCAFVAVSGSAASGFGAQQTLNNQCYGFVGLSSNTSGQAIAVQGASTLVTPGAPIVGILRSSGGSWGVPFDIAPLYYGRQRPVVGLADNGNILTVWRARTYSEYAIYENGAWSGPAELPQWSGTANPTVVVDSRGDAVISYGSKVVYRPAGGPFGTPIALNALELAATPGGSFAVATGSAIATLLPGSSTWNQNLATSGDVFAGAGELAAIVSPTTSVSISIVP
jgi:hypothetical protein